MWFMAECSLECVFGAPTYLIPTHLNRTSGAAAAAAAHASHFCRLTLTTVVAESTKTKAPEIGS